MKVSGVIAVALGAELVLASPLPIEVSILLSSFWIILLFSD